MDPPIPSSLIPMVITASYDNTIKFWNPTNCQVLRTASHPNSQVNCLEVHLPYVVAAGNPDVRFYALDYPASSLQSFSLNFVGHKDSVNGLGFEKDGRWMCTGSDDRSVKIWALGTVGCQRNFNVESPVNAVVVHPNQVEIICGCQDGMIRVIDLVAGRVAITIQPQTDDCDTIRSVSVSPDGMLLASGDDSGHVSIRQIPNNTASLIKSDTVKDIGAHDAYVLKCLFSPDGETLATCSSDTTAKLWKTRSWKPDKCLEVHREWVWDCQFSLDSKYLLTGSSDKMAMLWELGSGTTVKLYQGAHSRAISAVALYDFTLK